MKNRYRDIPPYRTKDGSEIRELMHPERHGNRNQSLAEAIVPPGTATLLHRHQHSEELYHVTTGHGWMTLGEERFEVAPGDTIQIPPDTPHRLENPNAGALKVLCCCAPPYSHDDTELLP